MYYQNDVTPVRNVISARDFSKRPGLQGIQNFQVSTDNLNSLRKMGICYDESVLNQQYQIAKNQRSAVAFDAVTFQPSQTIATVPTPIQFLQYWNPGQVAILTAVRKADELMGYATLGRWEDQQVVQTVIEMLGNPNVYLDNTDNIYATYNPSYNPRTIIRLQIGLLVTQLESRRAAAGMLDDAGLKRNSAALNLEVARNLIEFNGFNGGSGGTYGFLNAPELGNYTIVPTKASMATVWSGATTLEIINDILTAYAALTNLSGGNVNNMSPMTLAVPTNCEPYLSRATEFGYTVYEWLAKDYPTIRVVSAPQLQLAYSSSNVFYLYADSVQDDYSTDGGETWLAGGPTKLMLLGVQQLTDGFQERYSMATMGAMCKRPTLAVRYYGI